PRGVHTFDPTHRARGLISKLAAAGTGDPKPPVPGSRTVKRSFQLAPGGHVTLAGLRGPGEISALRLRVPQLVGPKPTPPITDDGGATDHDSPPVRPLQLRLQRVHLLGGLAGRRRPAADRHGERGARLGCLGDRTWLLDPRPDVVRDEDVRVPPAWRRRPDHS